MSHKVKQAFILAAGKGTRLGGLTQNCPKPLIQIGDQSILFRTLEILEEYGLEKVVINTHYLSEIIENSVANWVNLHQPDMEVIISHEDTILDIGGGLRQGLEFLDSEPFFVINGDIIWQEKRHPLLAGLAANYDENIMDSLMALSPIEMTKLFRSGIADVNISDDNLVTFPNPDDERSLIYMGVQVISPQLVSHINLGAVSHLRESWLMAAGKGRVSGYVYEYPWVDMGTPQGLNVANELVQQYMQKTA